MPSEPTTERGPVYGVELMSSLPLDGSGLMHQALPSRDDLEQVRKVSERTAAGYEVVLGHYQRAVVAADEAKDDVTRLAHELDASNSQRDHYRTQLEATEQRLAAAEEAWREMAKRHGQSEFSSQHPAAYVEQCLAAAEAREKDLVEKYDFELEELRLEIDRLTARLAAAEAALERANQLLQAATEVAFGEALTEWQVEHSSISDQAIRSAYELLDFHHEQTEQRLAAAEEAARILCDDLSQFTRTEWLLERWPWLADEAKGERDDNS